MEPHVGSGGFTVSGGVIQPTTKTGGFTFGGMRSPNQPRETPTRAVVAISGHGVPIN